MRNLMPVTIRLANLSDIHQIQTFVRSVYDASVAPEYSAEGNNEFYKYLAADWLEKRLTSDHWILTAIDQAELVGIIEIRENKHLSMLFIKTQKQRQGIGKKLLQAAIDIIKKNNPTQESLTVHSSPNSVSAYEHMGFEKLGEEQVKNGIRFTTMQMQL